MLAQCCLSLFFECVCPLRFWQIFVFLEHFSHSMNPFSKFENIYCCSPLIRKHFWTDFCKYSRFFCLLFLLLFINPKTYAHTFWMIWEFSEMLFFFLFLLLFIRYYIFRLFEWIKKIEEEKTLKSVCFYQVPSVWFISLMNIRILVKAICCFVAMVVTLFEHDEHRDLISLSRFFDNIFSKIDIYIYDFSAKFHQHVCMLILN